MGNKKNKCHKCSEGANRNSDTANSLLNRTSENHKECVERTSFLNQKLPPS